MGFGFREVQYRTVGSKVHVAGEAVCMGWTAGPRVQGSGFRVQGSGFRV